MTAPGAALFFLLGNHLNPFLMAAVGAFGAMISNFLIYYFVKYKANGRYQIHGYTRAQT